MSERQLATGGLVLGTVLCLVVPATADVAITQKVSGRLLGVGAASATSTTYIKNGRMRTETVTNESTEVTVVDLEAGKTFTFDLVNKEAEVYGLSAAAADMTDAADISRLKVALTPNKKTKTVLGRKTEGYDVTLSMPVTIEERQATVSVIGSVWIAKAAPGSADWARFFARAAARAGLGDVDPLDPQLAPWQSASMAELYRKMADTGGIPYEMLLTFTMDGGGPLASVISTLGGGSTTTTVTGVTVGPLADELFAPPAGYRLKPRQ